MLCPIDFSAASSAALLCAVDIVQRFDARLMLLTVDDPMLADAARVRMGEGWHRVNSERELRAFLGDALGPAAVSRHPPQVEVAEGKPALEILRVARESACDLMVMSTQGRSGSSKLVFGSTAERVLRETTVPVLVVPAKGAGPASVDAASRSGAPVLVPVDFSSATPRQTDIARRIASALNLPILLLHVIEPLHVPVPAVIDLSGLLATRLSQAQAELNACGQDTPAPIRWETMIEAGNAAEEIARVAREQPAALVVMGLHGPPAPGPRMGSVTYGVLQRAPVLTLALPPSSASMAELLLRLRKGGKPS